MALRVEQPKGPGPSDASFQEMAGAGYGQATQAPRGVKIPHDPAHYGEAEAVQAEESEG